MEKVWLGEMERETAAQTDKKHDRVGGTTASQAIEKQGGENELKLQLQLGDALANNSQLGHKGMLC